MSGFDYWKRELLYTEVWAQPMTKVSEKYGISDVAIAKICRRLRVPVPGRGYWARKAAGYTVKQTPLPPFKNPPVIPHRMHVQIPKPQIESTDPELIKIAEVESRAVSIPTVEHALITKSRRALEKARTDEYKRTIPPPSSSCIDVKVSKECLHRAHGILNAILFALEEEGLDVKVSNESTSVEVFGQQISFGIEEDLIIKEKREVKTYLGTRILNVYERSGKLVFRVWGSANGSRARWGDGKARKLEEILPKCFGGIFRNARALRIEKEIQRQRDLEWERRWAEEEERVRKINEEKERLKELEELMANWQKAQQIRAFMDAYEQMCNTNGEPTTPESTAGEWIAWARKKADWLDPLKP